MPESHGSDAPLERPNLIVIGGMKCGTTSLHYYLDLHPQIRMSSPKELNFFIWNWSHGLDWYRRHFRGSQLVHGESSPGYTWVGRFPEAAERMREIVPGARLIYLVRDPIERMVSHYMHSVWDDSERRSVEEALRATDRNPYLERSRYHEQLAHYLRYYPRSQILIVKTEDLLRHRGPTLRRVFEFLGVDAEFSNRRWQRRLHRTTWKRKKTPLGRWIARSAPLKLLYRLPPDRRALVERLLFLPFSRKLERPALSEDLRRELAARLGDELEAFRALTGRRFEGWSV